MLLRDHPSLALLCIHIEIGHHQCEHSAIVRNAERRASTTFANLYIDDESLFLGSKRVEIVLR